MPEYTDDQRRAEITRLRDRADEIERKIPLYEDRRPKLAKDARATVREYRKVANKIERFMRRAK